MRKSHNLIMAIVLIGVLFILFPLSCANANNANEIVTFPDPNLEAAVRRAIDKPTGDIRKSYLEGLTELYDEGGGIIDLTGLEHCTNLTTLYIWRNQVNDISPLSALTSLTTLHIERN